MDYMKLLEHSYAMAAGDECPPNSRLEFLGEQVDKGDMRDVLNLAAMIYVREIADMRSNG